MSFCAQARAAVKSPRLASILHTLACLYAEEGKTKEAHDLLLRGMDDMNLDEPNDAYWFAFGRIAEQYGEREIALADYRKLEKPKQPLAIPTSTWRLAQIRLKAMGTEGREFRQIGSRGGSLRSQFVDISYGLFDNEGGGKYGICIAKRQFQVRRNSAYQRWRQIIAKGAAEAAACRQDSPPSFTM